jgi:hypothetical protein
MRTTIGLLAAAATAAVLGFAWPRSSFAESPARFLAGVIRLLAANRYEEAWSSLSPVDQSIAPRAVYVACESQSPIPGHLASLRVLRIGRDRIGVAVTFALRIAGGAPPAVERVVVTVHAVRNGHRWAWILPAARRALYRSGCGLSPGPAA